MNISKDQIILIIIIVVLIIIGGVYYFYEQKDSSESKRLEILNSLGVDSTISVEEKENILQDLSSFNKDGQGVDEVTIEKKVEILNSLKK